MMQLKKRKKYFINVSTLNFILNPFFVLVGFIMSKEVKIVILKWTVSLMKTVINYSSYKDWRPYLKLTIMNLADFK
jgi:hypothetical protein